MTRRQHIVFVAAHIAMAVFTVAFFFAVLPALIGGAS